ncbi:LamG-like jellyroll fold domain-containing protein [Flavivirga eckloniae]|uniref:Secretion system C-terminal sorting domain-containing protein n=1 Tax=Flavivirga eckloniae TaxID=1803846 RepID=A0A2K9PKL4_9FLAO|nr:LamG-like jellyroll fold domain-containing protein [Flavivirga eckloniae]AUP77572.1 hypothetical protein C1H87_02085 [Flavivirga eckloniae]
MNRIRHISLFLLVFLFAFKNGLTQEFFIATNGSDSNSGTKSAPFATLEKARSAIRDLKTQNGGVLPESVTVWMRAGTYFRSNNFVIGTEDSGEVNKSISYRAYLNEGVPEQVIISGGVPFLVSSANIVTDNIWLNRFHPEARGKIWVINDLPTEVVETIINNHPSDSKINLFGKPYKIASWPNLGFVHMDKSKGIEKGVAWHSVVRDGPKPEWSIENPIGGEFQSIEPLSNLAEAEFLRTKKMTVAGHLGPDWHKEFRTVASIDGQRIKLADYTTYGINSGASVPRRFKILNVLCELDSPGEYYFDIDSQSLFLYPHEEIANNEEILVGQTDKLFHLNSASNIVIRDLVFSNGRNAVYIEGGDHNQVAGCTFKFNARYGVVITPKNNVSFNNGVVGCDFVDNLNAVNLEGGYVTPNNIVVANNYLLNSHIYQKELTEAGSRCIRLRGAGNHVANNLIHNISGQAIIWSGNDQLIEKNEIYSVQITEGDGGAIYTGADWSSWGNTIRYNFLHHLMCVPQLHPKGGIYLDDRDMGDNTYGNVFYKAAHRAILLNGGAGQEANENLFIEGYWGIYNNNIGSEDMYQKSILYENGSLARGDKMDYIYRLEQIVGVEGWNNPFWATKYPLMRTIINQRKDRYWPLEVTVENNCFFNNVENTWFGGENVAMDQVPQYISYSNNNKLSSLDVFEQPSVLNFNFKNGENCSGFNIPFDDIGLYLDEYRRDMPDKDEYRKNIKNHFDGVPSYDPEGVYDPETINEFVYYGFDDMPLAATYKYDFGTSESPVQSGWKRISPQSSGKKYWTGTKPSATNRETNLEISNINRDHITGVEPATLNLEVQNGIWELKFGIGDIDNEYDDILIKAEGKTIRSLLSTNKNQFSVILDYVVVEDGELNIEFSDQGGQTDRWIVNYLRLKKVYETPTGTFLSESPVAYWNFNETSGGVAKDIIGDADAIWQNGTNTNWNIGVEGNATDLSGGENDKFIVPSDPLFGTNKLSISVWLNMDVTGGYKGIITTRNNPTTSNIYNWGLSVENNNPNIDARYNSQGIDSGTNVYVGTWHHIIMTWDDSGKQNLYLDGSLVTSANSSITSYITGGNWWIGDDPCCAGREINAQIDELAMFNTVLTEEDVQLIYNSGLQGISIEKLIPPKLNNHIIDKPDRVKIYPNPTSGLLYIDLNKSYYSIKKIEITNGIGQKVFSKSFNSNSEQITIDISDLNSGFYCVVVNYSNDRSIVKKLLINK